MDPISRTPYGPALERNENVVFLGPPAVGKAHLAIRLAVAAAESGRRIYFGTLTDLIDSLEDAHAAGRLKQRLRTLTHPALLVVDEIGSLSVTPNGARLFFQLVNARYGRASTVLTSNKGFEHWGEILHDEVMAAALQGGGRRESPGWGRIVRRRDSGKAPALVATLPPRAPSRSVPFSMPESVPFSMPIDSRLPDGKPRQTTRATVWRWRAGQVGRRVRRVLASRMRRSPEDPVEIPNVSLKR